MGAAVAVCPTLRWAYAVSSHRARTSPTRRYHARTPTRRLITSCKTGSQEPLQHGVVLSSTSPLPSSATCLIITQDIQSGETIEHSGAILVKGNVSEGAVILASGDIVVLGELKGEAHAGRSGDAHAVIFAWSLKSKTLRIAGSDAKGPACHSGHICKVAYLSNGNVSVEDAGSKDFKFAPSTSCCDFISTRTTLSNGAKHWFAIDVMSMRKPSRVAAFTGAYIFVVGVALLLFPELLFGLFFSLRSSVREWIRIGAVLAVVFGVYYIGTAWGDAKGYNGADSFYVSTIVGRMFIFLSFSWLAAIGAGGLPLFIVGAVNLLGALTMLTALRSEQKPQWSS